LPVQLDPKPLPPVLLTEHARLPALAAASAAIEGLVAACADWAVIIVAPTVKAPTIDQTKGAGRMPEHRSVIAR
jgi:hypothetical protein